MDDFGMVGFPVYLTVVLVVASAVAGYFAFSVLFLENDIDSELVSGEVDVVVSEAESMYEYADQGSLSVVNVDFPENVCCVVFGGMPEEDNRVPSDLSVDLDFCNNYYFVMEDGECRCFSSFVNFCGRDTGSISVLYPGEYDLCLELVKSGGKSFVKVYPE